ncbi:MAG: hypothetical protein ACO3N7_11310 [Kiritimatiellia bacterium]
MQKIFTGLLGLLLLPFAFGLACAAYAQLIAVQMSPASSDWIQAFALGAALWLLLFFVFPRPLRSYILAHELSHLLAAWMSGIGGGRLRVGRDGGSVEVARSNLWIALAPYLIPFYSLGLLALHLLASLWWDPRIWRDGLPYGLGFTWAFHLSFTLYILSIPQSDVQPYGRLGAYSFILTGNLLLLVAGLFLINGQPFSEDLGELLQLQLEAYRGAARLVSEMIFRIKNAIIEW